MVSRAAGAVMYPDTFVRRGPRDDRCTRRIVYVSVDEARVDMRVRSADSAWGDETVEGLAAVLALPEIGASLPMAEVYEETDLAAPSAQPS